MGRRTAYLDMSSSFLVSFTFSSFNKLTSSNEAPSPKVRSSIAGDISSLASPILTDGTILSSIEKSAIYWCQKGSCMFTTSPPMEAFPTQAVLGPEHPEAPDSWCLRIWCFLVFGDVTRSGRSQLANQELNDNRFPLRRKQRIIRRKLIWTFCSVWFTSGRSQKLYVG